MRVGFIGFGEAASSIAIGLHEEGCESICFYDALQEDPSIGRRIDEKSALCCGRKMLASSEVCRESEVVLCAVPSAFSESAANEAVDGITPGLVYVDVTTASPLEKRRICQVVEKQGASFVDAAMMGTLLKDRHRVPMFLCGSGTSALCEKMAPYHMRLMPLNGDVGAATSLKFIRSITAKGLSCLLFESLQAAQRFGVEEHIVESLVDSFGAGFEKIISGYVSGAIIHAQRREHELRNVVDFLKQENLPYTMAEATREKLRWIHDQGIGDKFCGEDARNWRDVLKLWDL